MAKYRKKPVIVDAVRWWGAEKTPDSLFPKVFHGVIKKLPFWKTLYIGLSLGLREYRCPPCKYGWVATLEGGHIISEGDYLIMGVKGEFYPCKPDIFEQTYEKVED